MQSHGEGSGVLPALLPPLLPSYTTWAKDGKPSNKPRANKHMAAEITERYMPQEKHLHWQYYGLQKVWVQKWTLLHQSGLWRRKWPGLQKIKWRWIERKILYLYVYLYIGGTTEDFAAVAEESGFPSEARGIHVNRKQWAACSSQRYKKPLWPGPDLYNDTFIWSR